MPEPDSHCPKTVDSASLRGIRSHPAGHLPAVEPPTIVFWSSGGATGRRPGARPDGSERRTEASP